MSTITEEKPNTTEPVIGLAVVPDQAQDDLEQPHDTGHDGQPPEPPTVGRVAYAPKPEQPKHRRWLRALWYIALLALSMLVGWLLGRGAQAQYRDLFGETL